MSLGKEEILGHLQTLSDDRAVKGKLYLRHLIAHCRSRTVRIPAETITRLQELGLVDHRRKLTEGVRQVTLEYDAADADKVSGKHAAGG